MNENIPSPQESGPEVAELEGMIASFEARHSLPELQAIVDLSFDLTIAFKYAADLADPRRIENDIAIYEKHNPIYVPEYKAKIAAAKVIIHRLKPKDARKFEIRMAAKKDLIPITTKLNNLKGNKDYQKLKAKCTLLFRAVGSLQDDKINHS